MTRRILVINANTSASMTEHIRISAEAYKLADTEITCMTAAEGPEVIETYTEDFISAVEVLKLVLAERDHYDAFIIAASPDPGLFGAREITTKPVLGIGQSPLLVAPLLGRKFSILGHWKGDKPRSEDKVAKYHLSPLLASVRTVGESPKDIQADQEGSFEKLVALGRQVIEEDGAEVLIMTGAAFAGMHHQLSRRLGVPVLEGISCAVKLAEILIDLGLQTTRVGQYLPLSQPKGLVGLPEFQQFEIYQTREPVASPLT